MAGIVNNPNKRREKLLLRPVEGEEWEAWAFDDPAQPRLAGACATPAEALPTPQSVLALPLRQLFAVPLWLATTDPAFMRDMIFLQLERRGLAGRSAQDAVFDYRIVSSTENQTLVLAVALPNSLPEHLCLAELSRFEPSARTYRLQPDELTLWTEGDRLVFAATRGAELVYFQTLGDGVLSDAVLQELLCAKLQLEGSNILVETKGVTAWGAFASPDLDRLRELLGVPVKSGKRPAPALPSDPFHLVPRPVQQAQQLAKISRRRRTLVAAAVGVYFLMVLGLLLRVGWFYLQCSRIETDLKANKALVSEISSSARRWDAMEAAIDPESYPIEQLLRCARVLPPSGVRFTLFSINNGRIIMQGEARDAPSAFTFAEDLKKSKELLGYRWQMPQPKLLQNDNAEFQIEGARR